MSAFCEPLEADTPNAPAPAGVGGLEKSFRKFHGMAGLKATHCLADVLRDIKSGSSRWIHDEKRIRSFDWQEGYGAVTVSPSGLTRLRRYIARQEEHHRKKTFQDEFREFLDKCGIAYDERYLW